MSKVALPEENHLQALYIDLNKACTVSDYDKVINIANKILKKYPDELKAFHCRIISLMHMENFDSALKLINSNNNGFIDELLFEKSYCEYRLNRLDDALSTIKSANGSDIRIQELFGQIMYKQEKYDEALDKYKYLMKNAEDAYEEERAVNMTAAVTALCQWSSVKKDFPNVPENMFELCVNKACHMAATGKYEDAIKTLNKAEKMCMDTFEGDQDVTAAEIDEEISVIKVQEAYCLQKLGKVHEASVIYHDILKKRCGDSQVLAIAANNVVCINKDQNIFDSRKKIKMTMGDSVQQKLLSWQKEQISVNNLLFQYYSNQGDTVKSTCDLLLKSGGQSSTVKAALIKSAQLAKEKQYSVAIKSLEEHLEQLERTGVSEEDLVKAQLSLAQLNLIHGSLSACNTLLGDLPVGYRHRFGVLGTRVTLFLLSEEVQLALDCLDSALDWYNTEASVLKKGQEKESRYKQYEALLKVAASLAMRHKKEEQAAKYYELLLKRRSGDQSVLASLIAAYSRIDRAQAEKYTLLLKDEKQLPEVDVDSLESAFIFGVKHMKKLLKGGEVTPKPGSTVPGDISSNTLKAKKKKRKTKLPKSYDPSKVPDSERWLPKRERAHYRAGRKRDKRRDNIFRGPQGAVTSTTDTLDASKKPSAPATPSAEPVKKTVQQSSSATQQSNKNKKNKSKKKGGKW